MEPEGGGASKNEWAQFNEVKDLMASEEHELSTDEEEVEARDRDELLQAASARLRRESTGGDQDQAGRQSEAFNDRAQHVFGALGGARDPSDAPLRFWTSIHGHVIPGHAEAAGHVSDSAAQAGASWNPLDDLDDLSAGSESDGAGDPDAAGMESRGEQSKRALEARLPRGGARHPASDKRTKRVSFGPDVAAADDATAARELAPHAGQPRAGYTHYSLADIESAEQENKQALAAAMAAVRPAPDTAMDPLPEPAPPGEAGSTIVFTSAARLGDGGAAAAAAAPLSAGSRAVHRDGASVRLAHLNEDE